MYFETTIWLTKFKWINPIIVLTSTSYIIFLRFPPTPSLVECVKSVYFKHDFKLRCLSSNPLLLATIPVYVSVNTQKSECIFSHLKMKLVFGGKLCVNSQFRLMRNSCQNIQTKLFQRISLSLFFVSFCEGIFKSMLSALILGKVHMGNSTQRPAYLFAPICTCGA